MVSYLHHCNLWTITVMKATTWCRVAGSIVAIFILCVHVACTFGKVAWCKRHRTKGAAKCTEFGAIFGQYAQNKCSCQSA